MNVRQTGAEWVVSTPAKVNLFLEVLGKRDDGFHEIETLMAPINLYDTLYFRDDPGGQVRLACEAAVQTRSATADQIPEGSENLVVRAIERLRGKLGIASGASLRLVKRIPAAAGLAGGSSDAAAALVAANAAWNLGLSADTLAEFAAELGSDIPFFLGQGAAVCRGRGERIEPVATARRFHLVAVRPAQGLSTAAVYRQCRAAAEPRRVEAICAAWQSGDVHRLGRELFNRLQPPAEAMCPAVAQLRGEFERLGVIAHQMSGSGTSYFGLCHHARHARRVAERLRARGYERVFTLQTASG